MRSFLLTTIICIGWVCATLAQADIAAVMPNSAYVGQEASIVIRGDGTHFSQGLTSVTFGPGIDVLNTFVTNPFTLSARVRVQSNAALGPRDVVVVSGAEQVSVEEGFEVLEGSSGVLAIMEVIPVEMLYIADFDPSNAANAPLLFTISVLNDNQERNLTVRFTLSGEEYGLLGTAERIINPVAPTSTTRVTNRDFDSYSITDMGSGMADKIRQTGLAPPDLYTYKVEVFDQNGTLLAEDDATNIISNPTADLELIFPGNPMYEQPEPVMLAQPLFQWFSTASQFVFTVYEVNEWQSTEQEITQNNPVYRQENISGQSLFYPNSAEKLRHGVTYAWQVQARITTSSGEWMMPSPLYWFTVGEEAANHAIITELVIEPSTGSMKIAEQLQFTLTAYDLNGAEVPVVPHWKVVASDAGKVDENGLFTAGWKPKTVAIVAEAGGLSEYAVVTIEWAQEQLFHMNILRPLFGLDKPIAE